MATPAQGPAEGPCSTAPEGPEVHPADQKLHPSRLVPAALRHIAARYAGVVTPPLIIGQAVRLDTAGRPRLIAGAATLRQTLGVKGFVGNRLPFVNAASPAGIAPMPAIAVPLGAGIIPLAAPTFYAGFPAWAQTVLGSGIRAGALLAVSLNLFFHHLGTRGGTSAAALKSS